MSIRLTRGPSLGLVAVAALDPGKASAHSGAPPAPHDALSASAWTLSPLLLIGLVAAAWLYGDGVHQIWHRAGAGRGVSRWRVAAFGGGIVALVVALVSPLDAIATSLFSVHMVQHLILMLIAAPLLVLGEPLAPSLWGLPTSWRRGLVAAVRRRRGLLAAWRLLTHPVVAWVLQAAVLWTWHLPALYQAALRHEAVHVGEHLSMLGAALLFWWTVIPSRGRRLGYGGAIVSVFTTGLQSSALGALLAFSAAPWYPLYAGRSEAWGLTPMADQQIAGLVMWVPAGLVYLGAALALLAGWLKASDGAYRSGAPVAIGQREATALIERQTTVGVGG